MVMLSRKVRLNIYYFKNLILHTFMQFWKIILFFSSFSPFTLPHPLLPLSSSFAPSMLLSSIQRSEVREYSSLCVGASERKWSHNSQLQQEHAHTST